MPASEYSPEFAREARLLCLYGASDESIADFYGIDMPTLALWAWSNKDFYEAITPTKDEIAAYLNGRKARRSVLNARRKAYLTARPGMRIRAAVSARMWAALKGRSDRRLFSRLEYSLQDLMLHLESRFESGMSWDNYGEWHVDHIKPCAMFDLTDPFQFADCWSLTNLQPLWATDNLRKATSYAGG